MSIDIDSAELNRIQQVRRGECSCHLSPPCNWCILLDEDEAEAYFSGGRVELDLVLNAKVDK